jgi:PAS domain S-box-containing protein
MATNSQIKAEISKKLGFLPSFFAPAIDTPPLLAILWQQTLAAYYQNPLPDLFKEKLFVYLGRYCSVPYFVICHSCNLRSLGMTAREILELNQSSVPESEADLAKDFQNLTKPSTYRRSWHNNPSLEKSIVRCAVLLFLQPSQAETCRQKLRQFLGMERYNYLVALLSYIKLSHQWVESHPEISYETDRRAQLHLASLLLEEIKLAVYFQTSKAHSLALLKPINLNSNHQTQNASLCQEKFRLCFTNAPFPMMIHRSDGKILHLNKSWQETTGYGIEEIPTVTEWTKRANLKRQEIVRSPNQNLDTEAAFQRMVNSLLNLPYKLDRHTEPRETTITTRSEVTVTTRNGEKRFWDLFSAPVAQLSDGSEITISMAKDITNLIVTEAELIETSRQLELVLETSHSGIWHWNLQTNLVNLDSRALAILSLSDHSFDGSYSSFLQTIHPQERQSVDLAAIKAVKAKRELEIEYRVVWVDGTLHWVRTTAKPVKNSSNRVVAMIGVIIDITKEKQPQTQTQQLDRYREQDLFPSLERLETIFNLLPYHIFVLERDDLRISYCNQIFAHSLGFDSPEQLRGKTIEECFPPEHREYFRCSSEQIFRTGKSLHQSETLTLFDGLHQFDTYKIPLKKSTGEVYAILHTACDLPDVITVKQALSERSVQLEAANRELESFSYSVSHDLQAPLRAISGFSQIMWERYQEQFDDLGKHYLQRIQANSQHMGELIEALLQLSRVTRSQMQFILVDLSAIAQEIMVELKARQPNRQVEAVVEPNLVVKGDPRLLRIVLNNLLDNAWKYTANQAQAKIAFKSISHADGSLAYCVRDNGVGFEQHLIDKLFVPFQRLHSEAEFPGTGIGLATVGRIIYRHGGKVWAEGNPNQGATFYFSL